MTAFRIAGTGDDDRLRRLLRDNGMPGWVEMCIEREPSYFAGQDRFGRDWAVLAEEGDALVGMYAASALPLYVNGAEERVGYLGGLRVQPEFRHRIRHLREGYASIRPLAQAPASLPWWFTVVAADNTVARHLLEAGVRGLPRYRTIGGYNTYAVTTSRGRSQALWRKPRPDELPALLAWHRQRAAQQQLSPVLDEPRLARLGADGLWICSEREAIFGMAVLWNQGAYKQVVARRYRGALQGLRPLYNVYARMARRVVLPPPGDALGQTFIAFLSIAPEVATERSTARALLTDLLSHCTTPVAAFGLHDGHALEPALQSLKPMRYAARVYAVEFDTPARLDGRPVQPEAALL